jgi:hypothetical protein
MGNQLKRTGAALALVAAGLAGTVVAAPAASATVRQICAQDLYVRQQPAGVMIGTLYYHDNFDFERYSPSGQWAYGHAYGNVHRNGWVQAGWFC